MLIFRTRSPTKLEIPNRSQWPAFVAMALLPITVPLIVTAWNATSSTELSEPVEQNCPMGRLSEGQINGIKRSVRMSIEAKNKNDDNDVSEQISFQLATWLMNHCHSDQRE